MLGALALSWNISCIAEELAPCYAYCPKWDPCSMPYGLNAPLVRPVADCCNWTASLDYLYWRPFVENNVAAQLIITDRFSLFLNLDARTHIMNQQKDLKYDWDSGFRVGLGYALPCDRWVFNVAWTHYRTDANLTETGYNEREDLVPGTPLITGKMPLISGLIQGSSLLPFLSFQNGLLEAAWKFQFDQVDFDISREFYVGCSMSIKPYLGLRTLFLKNREITEAVYDKPLVNNFHLAQYSIDRELTSNFKAVGLKAGVDSFYAFLCGLGIYGNFSTALLFAEHQINSRYDSVQKGFRFSFKVDNETPYDYHGTRFMTDLALGIEWRELINCNRALLVFKAGWEHHLLVGASRFQETDIDSNITYGTGYKIADNAGDISLYGFVFSIGISI